MKFNINGIKSILKELVVSLSTCKSLLNTKTYLNLLPILVGISELRHRKISIVYCGFIILFLYQLLLFSFGVVPTGSVARAGQMMILGFFGDYLIREFKYLDMKKIIWIVVAVSCLLVSVEFFYNNSTVDRYGLGINRMSLIVGEPNFSSFIYSLLFAMALSRKMYVSCFLLSSFIFFTQSRMGILAIFFTSLVFVFRNQKKITKCFIGALAIFTAVYPVIIFSIHKIGSVELKKFLISKLSTRFYIQSSYMELLLENPLGLGYFNATSYIGEFYSKNESYLVGTLDVLKTSLEIAQAHNFHVHFLTEFGVLGSVFYIFFMFSLYKNLNENLEKQMVFTTLIICSTLLNCSHEIALFLGVALILDRKKIKYFQIGSLKEGKLIKTFYA